MVDAVIPRIRVMDADQLGIGVKATAESSHTSSSPDRPEVEAADRLVQEIMRLANLFGGVILSGPPGTSKSFYAAATAEALTTGDAARQEYVQFHASYQYEDFMLGFRPRAGGGFETRDGPFLRLVRKAEADPSEPYVLVIDELSRADVGRVFGEALTYVDRTKRELPVTISNGDQIRIPQNLFILATMNPFDRGVDEVDAAFERRFAKVTMDPSREILREILLANDMAPSLLERVVNWFNRINGYARRNPAAAVGHAYFVSASDVASLSDIWDYQLKYLVERAFRRDEATRESLETAWRHVVAHSSNEIGESEESSSAGEDEQSE